MGCLFTKIAVLSSQATRFGTSGLWSHRPRIKRKAGLVQMALSVDTDRFGEPESFWRSDTLTTTRIIGIDLAVEAAHKAIVLDQARNAFVSQVLSFQTDPAEIDRVLEVACAGAPDDVRLVAVLEATDTRWHTVGVYLARHAVEVYRVTGQQVADQRRVYHRYAKSDRVDVRVLARLPLLYPERLTRLAIPSGAQLALQQACREVARLTQQRAAIKQRLQAIDRWAWPGLQQVLAAEDPARRWVRECWYDPWAVCAAGAAALTQAWQAASPQSPAEIAWIAAFVACAQRVVSLYGHADALPHARFQATLQREQARLDALADQVHTLRLKVVRPLYRHLYPQRYLETLPGVAQDSAAVYIAWVGDIQRFPSAGHFRGWSGLTPFSRQTGESQARGLHITQAGPDVLKATAFLNAQVARLYDPQIAAVYYTQMMDYGKHHLQAVCACATHLLDRIYVVLRQNRPYQLRDVDGTPVTKQQARRICQERFTVPAEVRRRNNHRVRRARREEWLERREQQRSSA